MKAQGTFTVQLDSAPPYDVSDGVTLGRTSIKKQFVGDLSASSTVEMLGARTSVKGSAGYVAIEHVRGVLMGRSGSFVLSHTGTMDRGRLELILRVVPDSGSGELTGLRGSMTIDIQNGTHFYGFDYEIEPTPSGDTP